MGENASCQELASILNARVSTLATPGTCTITNIRTFPMTVLGRRTSEPLNNIFYIQKTTIPNRTLNMGFLALLPNEVTFAVNGLTRQGIKVTAITPFTFFAKPNIINVFLQSLEHPIQFVQKVNRVLSKIPLVAPDVPEPPINPAYRQLCKQFSAIIGGNQIVDIIGTSCEVVRLRNTHVYSMGQLVTNPETRLLNFSFDKLDAQGRSLCSATVGLFRHEVGPYINALRKQKSNVIITPLFTPYFTTPNFLYLQYLSIENPITFAIASRKAISTLT
ncbi:DUF1259 domain-containing protein [Marininema halotolerans]|uniref:Uncharacterized protein n=1 Tax=Marininema halotolerans TaxID=1155944 RepID=A0A1I6R8Z5_9BACL|nr:DUF1259 domain-containing protein [Marininema halotolerans]SFS61164.1 protein of unknown function [Marininema halotolerans]